jgi:Ca2+-binding EF-hand superfamily protein
MVNLLNVNKTKAEIKQVFIKYDSDKNGTIDRDEVVHLLDHITERQDIREEYFDVYKDPHLGLITPTGLMTFLREV